jgi:valyl-tRNA synthetase
MMETGYDILFFWVARMIMMGLEFTGSVPFNTIYLHGLVRVEGGRKMSKSYGNIIDPLEIIEKFGTDALRFTLLTGSTPGTDMTLDPARLEANRNFANKLWNIGRLVLMSLETAPAHVDGEIEETAADEWILARLRELRRDVNRLMETHQYAEAGRQILDFVWNEYADWYLEIAKLQLEEEGQRAGFTAHIMIHVLDTCLRLLHPYMPFVTEELWGKLKAACQAKSGGYAPREGWAEALILARWPEAESRKEGDREAISEFSLMMETVRAIRNARSEHQVEAGRQIAAIIDAGEKEHLLQKQAPLIAAMAKVDPEGMAFRDLRGQTPEGAVALVVGAVEIFLPLEEMVDLDAERARLQEELQEAQEQVRRLEELLAGPFSERAPVDVVEQERGKLGEMRATQQRLQSRIESLPD